MNITRLRKIDIRLLVVCSNIHCRSLNFKEMWNLLKFQRNKRYDEKFLHLHEDIQYFKSPVNTIREIGDLSPFMWD